MLKKLLIIVFITSIIPIQIVIARDPYPNKPRSKHGLVPAVVEDHYGRTGVVDPETMIRTDGLRSDAISFCCYFGGKQNKCKYLNNANVDTMEKATQSCNADSEWKNYTDRKSVEKPFLKNNKNVGLNEEKYDINGYDWPVGQYIGSHPKAAKDGSKWGNPIVYSAQEGTPKGCGATRDQLCDCIYTPLSPKNTWIRVKKNDRECVAPSYSTSGPFWDWYKGQVDSIQSHIATETVSVGFFLGIDGEGRPYKSQDDGWVPVEGENTDPRSNFYNGWIQAVQRDMVKRYPNKVIRGHADGSERDQYIEAGIDFHRESLNADGTGDYFYKGLGDWGWWQGFSNYFYLTKSGGLQNWVPMYQTVLGALSQHVDSITGVITNPWLFDEGRGDFLKFYTEYMGKDINDTPGVWTNLRQTIKTKEIQDNTSGKYGDFDYFLYRAEDLDGNKTVPVSMSELPQGARNQIYSYDHAFDGKPLGLLVARKNAPGNNYMSFDVDDGYRYVGDKPGQFDIRIIFLDTGIDSFKFQYKNNANQIQEKIITKTNVNKWKEEKFTIDNTLFNNNMSEGSNASIYPTDFRLETNGSTIHLVEVRGRGTPSLASRPKAQVSCDIVRNKEDDPKNGIYSIGLNQNIFIRAKLVDNNDNPITNTRIMFSYNTEWNLAKSASTDSQGLAFSELNTANRLDSTGFVGAGGRLDQSSTYSVQALFPGNSQYQPSRNDCLMLMTNSTGPNDSRNAKIKITNIDSSQTKITGKVVVSYQILDLSGGIIESKTDTIGRVGRFYVEDPNSQTLPILWNSRKPYHPTFNNITVKGTGDPYPTAIPPTSGPTNTPGGPTNTPGPSPTPDPCPNGDKGNIDCDQQGLINETDLNILLNSWNPNGPVPTPITNQRSSDLNNDGKINNDDLNILLTNWKTN